MIVEVECITSTAADSDYYEAERVYSVDMAYAKRRGIWKYFRPLREIPEKEAQDRVNDEILPARRKAAEKRREANEEDEAKLAEVTVR